MDVISEGTRKLEKLKRLGATSLKILLYGIEKDEGFTALEVSEQLGIPIESARKQIERLHKYGFLRRLEKGNYVVDKNRILEVLFFELLLRMDLIEKIRKSVSNQEFHSQRA